MYILLIISIISVSFREEVLRTLNEMRKEDAEHRAETKNNGNILEKMWKEGHPDHQMEYPLREWRDEMELALVRIYIIIYCISK